MEKNKTKKKWEKPELKKLGLEIEHCCSIGGPSSNQYSPASNENPDRKSLG